MLKACEICSKPFFTVASKIKKGHGRFCSKKCKGIYMKGDKNYNYKGGNIKKVCLECGCIYEEPFHRKDISKFCSNKCYGNWQSKNRRGENHYNWKGGMTTLVDKERGSRNYLLWRQNVIIRDNFTCQECGQKGGKLHAHHLKPFVELVKEAIKYLPLFDVHTACLMYSPLWDIGNGKTFCENCHKKTEKEARKK